MKVAIIGYGFVGKALADGFLDTVEVIKIDPKLNTDIKKIIKFKPDIIFVCLPTPMKDDSSQDISIVKEVFKEISQINNNYLVVLKSTVLPDNIQELSLLNKDFIYNPEFLREKHAENDFINADMIILGGGQYNQDKVKKLYKNHSICKTNNYILTDKITASLIKYTINSFLASKVTFFNQLKNLFNSSGASEDWDVFTKILATDKRIGTSHMDVPGHDKKLGFGGACFTKDTAALVKYSKAIGKEFTLLKKAVEINNKIRSKYDDIDQREKDQNVTYNPDD